MLDLVEYNFDAELMGQLRRGEKLATWRVNDNKGIKTGQVIGLRSAEERVRGITWFGTAVVREVVTKPYDNLTSTDREGHERYQSDEQALETFRGYYPNENIGPATPITVIKFVLWQWGFHDEQRTTIYELLPLEDCLEEVRIHQSRIARAA